MCYNAGVSTLVESNVDWVSMQREFETSLVEHGMPFAVEGAIILMQFPMREPMYTEALNRINGVKRDMVHKGVLKNGLLNRTRGPAIGADGEVYENIEQYGWFFMNDDEFEEVRDRVYSPRFFHGNDRNVK